MSTTPSRFGTDNLASLADAAVLKNGTGGGAPALVQDAAFPMSNLLLNDRKVLWSSGVLAGSSVTVDIVLGGASTVSAISVHGLRISNGGSWGGESYYTQTGTYTPGGTWTNAGTSPGFVYPDTGSAFTPRANVTAIRVVFGSITGTLVCGKIFAGDPSYVTPSYVSDQGTREDTPQRNATILTYPSGSVFAFNLGDQSRIIKLQFSNITAAQAAFLQGLAGLVQPFVYLDASGAFWDVILASKQVPTKQTDGTPHYACTLDLLGIP